MRSASVGTVMAAVMAAIVSAALLAFAAVAAPAVAAPPGAVQWAHLDAGPCRLVALPGAERALTPLALSANVIVPRLELRLGIRPRAPYTVLLIPAGAPSAAAQEISRGVPEWAAGWMNAAERRGAIRLEQASRYPFGTPEGVLAHESAHLLLGDAARGRLPLWFEEGVATWAARDWQLQDALMLSAQVIAREPPRLADLDAQFHGSAGQAEEAYAVAFAFVSWAEQRFGDALPRRVVARAASSPFAEAWRQVTGITLDDSEQAWRRDSQFRYRWLPVLVASGSLWLLVLLLSTLVWWRRQRRAQEIQRAWTMEGVDSEDWDPTLEPGDAGVDSERGPGGAGEPTPPAR